MYVFKYTNICKYMCIYMYVYIYIHIYMCVYIHTCIYMYTCIYIHIYAFIYISQTHQRLPTARLSRGICIYIYICIYRYILTYLNIHMYIAGVPASYAERLSPGCTHTHTKPLLSSGAPASTFCAAQSKDIHKYV